MSSSNETILRSHTADAHAASAEVPMAEHTHEVNTFVLVKWLVAIIVILAVAIFGIVQLFEVVKLHQVRTTVEVDTRSHADYLKHREKMRTELSWGTDKREWHAVDAKNVQIPIDDAMNKVIDKYGKNTGTLDNTLTKWAKPTSDSAAKK